MRLVGALFDVYLGVFCYLNLWHLDVAGFLDYTYRLIRRSSSREEN